MRISKEEINKKYLDEHNKLSEKYYKNHELTKKEFDKLHGGLWRRYEEDLVKEGYAREITEVTYTTYREIADPTNPEKKLRYDTEPFTFDRELTPEEERAFRDKFNIYGKKVEKTISKRIERL